MAQLEWTGRPGRYRRVQGGLAAPSLGLAHQAGTPGPGRVTLRLPVPSQSEGDGLASDPTHPLSPSHYYWACLTTLSVHLLATWSCLDAR